MTTISNKKFQITLDRDPPIYYAGEIVTGNLAVNPDQNEKCRSLQVELHGKARVHWHTGSGDNRTDYDGRKQFLLTQRTLWGNFYRTALLDGAGESAEFGNAVGDGTMYIPCLPNEGEHGGGAMRLIVRVCDYDWGKKDDNIGEIIIDAKELASANDSITYNLTRRGKPEQGTITLAGRFVPASAFMPDPSNARSTGMSHVASSELFILTVLKADNLRKADFFGKNDVYVQAWRAPNDLPFPPIPGKNIPDPSKNTVLPNGRTEYKFAFQTRADSPGSASFDVSDYAYIAYYVYAKIDKKWKRDPSIKLPITIIPSRPVPLPPLLAPFQEESMELPLYKMKFCCFSCGEAGTAKIKVKLGRRAYAPGESIDLFCDLSNNSTLSVDLKVVLRQHIIMTTSYGGSHTKREKKFVLFEKHCEAQSSLTVGDGHGSIERITVPAVPPSFFGARGLVAGGRSIDPLTFTYELEVQAKADSGSKANIKIPILISALPPKSDAVLAASGQIPVPVFDDVFGVKQFTVTDDSPCDTVKPHTGKEDGGDIVPSVTGGTNIWSAEEDKGSGAQSYVYTPSVMVFPTHTNNDGGTMNISYEEENTKTDVQESVNSRGAYDALLSSMSTDYDSRLAVDKWIKKYPSSASSLSSEQFAKALTKVLFSLEQPVVARELMSGLAPGVLTTEYIVKAMKACPYNKTEIAIVMAPNASDPENKNVVLDQVYSYERPNISKMFTA